MPYQVHDELFLARCREIIRRLPRGGTFLDVGIGDGWLTKQILDDGRFEFLVGLDKYKERPIYFTDAKIADAHHLPFPDHSFDNCGCFECLEHVAYPDVVVDELARVTKPQGHVHITVPIGRRQLDPGHKHFFAKRDLEKLMRGIVVETLPIGKPPRWFWGNWIPWK